jgi:hypothetical protein
MMSSSLTQPDAVWISRSAISEAPSQSLGLWDNRDRQCAHTHYNATNQNYLGTAYATPLWRVGQNMEFLVCDYP